MKIGTKELIHLICELDNNLTEDEEYTKNDIKTIKLLIKFSKELHKRGYINIVSNSWINEDIKKLKN